MKSLTKLAVILGTTTLLLIGSTGLAQTVQAIDPATCSITATQDTNDPFLYHTTISWSGAYNSWHLFHWGDEAQTHNGPVGYFGSSGTSSWDHVYNGGTWQQWSNLSGPGGNGNCIQTVTAQYPPSDPATCSITSTQDATNPLLYHSTVTWSGTYDNWSLFHWGDEAVTGAEGPGFFGKNGMTSWDHEYDPGTWQQWANVDGPGGGGGCVETVTVVTPPQPNPPVCSVTTTADSGNPLLYHSTLTWDGAMDGWHLFYWGDEGVTGTDPVGYFGQSGSTSWDHLYNAGTWQQWSNLEGPGGWGGCLETITAQN